MPSRQQRIEQALQSALSSPHVVVRDDSHHHAGHAGARPEGETHYHVDVMAACFEGLSRVARQRMVYAALKDEFAQGLHALSLTCRSPSEV